MVSPRGPVTFTFCSSCRWSQAHVAHIAQSVEHILGKDEVTGSIPVVCLQLNAVMTTRYDGVFRFVSGTQTGSLAERHRCLHEKMFARAIVRVQLARLDLDLTETFRVLLVNDWVEKVQVLELTARLSLAVSYARAQAPIGEPDGSLRWYVWSMRKPVLGAMTILSFLAGCFGARKPEKVAVKPYPRFPETDVPGLAFEHIELGNGFQMKPSSSLPTNSTCTRSATRTRGTRAPDDPRPAERTDAAIFEMDPNGKPLRHLELRGSDDGWGTSIGMIGNELMFYSGDHFIVINTSTMKVAEKIPVWHEQHFPTKQDIEMMTRDEYIPAYLEKFDAAMEKCTDCHWLVWPSGKYFVYVAGAAGKRALWSPIDYTAETIEPLKKKFPTISVVTNPGADSGVSNPTIVDGSAKIREEAEIDDGQELDYPNYKNRSIVQYELTIGSRVIHFSTGDRNRQDRRVGFADNNYITTADGAVWLRHMHWLYRVQ